MARASALGAYVEATATPREVVFELTDVGRLVDSAGVAGPLPPPTTITTFTTGESIRVGEARPSS